MNYWKKGEDNGDFDQKLYMYILATSMSGCDSTVIINIKPKPKLSERQTYYFVDMIF